MRRRRLTIALVVFAILAVLGGGLCGPCPRSSGGWLSTRFPGIPLRQAHESPEPVATRLGAGAREGGLKRRNLYNTRHTFATHALASGEDPGWVAKMLGHTTLTMLMTRYYRYVPNFTRRDGTLLNRQLARRRTSDAAS